MTAKYSEYEFRTQPWFDQDNFQGFNQAIPMKTMVICCFDPRAAEVPQIVSEHFGDEVYPGQNVLDEHGNKIGHTRTLFTVYCAGGRAASALQSIATMDYLFNVQKVVVVHHSFCGATGFRPDQLIDRYRDCHHADISAMFDHDSLAIMNFEDSLRHDIKLLRETAAVPSRVQLYGFFYEMNKGELIEVVRDLPA
ncbi:carbonic anhydrase [Paraburkholderia sp. DHOC27]|uniref:carbonic anhydrase n=1 Tax=Paraburkholderia sp. DHOC27 TaxID=2303330 RepID=UPI000E3C1F16|nr:carbonic anhydrase [Paraburkholderia sp. DHOC27]RFU44887.1 carbonic anhydrase [Paraburkholderia sp. DHOC27]